MLRGKKETELRSTAKYHLWKLETHSQATNTTYLTRIGMNNQGHQNVCWRQGENESGRQGWNRGKTVKMGGLAQTNKSTPWAEGWFSCALAQDVPSPGDDYFTGILQGPPESLFQIKFAFFYFTFRISVNRISVKSLPRLNSHGSFHCSAVQWASPCSLASSYYTFSSVLLKVFPSF